MARRRERIAAPSADDLTKMEEEFRRETSPRGPSGGLAPIAQVAAESAKQAPVASAQERAQAAQDQADAERLREADADGRLIREIPIDEIAVDLLIRDRIQLHAEEMAELQASIRSNGLRLPIEVTEADGDKPYGLISGYRRMMATKALHATTGDRRFETIKALVRPPVEAGAAFASMVEENEIRAGLSPFERGRIAVLSTQQGAFVNVEAAVNALFAHASKAKRSKVRSFALVYEELGDMLRFAEGLSEKRGLLLAQGLRSGGEEALRNALAAAPTPETLDKEWALLEPVLQGLSDVSDGPAKGGRPRKEPELGWQNADVLRTSAGITIRKQRDKKGFVLRLEGKLDDELMQSLMQEIQYLLEKP